MNRQKFFVKTVYDACSHRDPDISEYENKSEAQSSIDICLQWGINIVSCEMIEDPSLKHQKN